MLRSRLPRRCAGGICRWDSFFYRIFLEILWIGVGLRILALLSVSIVVQLLSSVHLVSDASALLLPCLSIDWPLYMIGCLKEQGVRLVGALFGQPTCIVHVVAELIVV